MKNISATQKIIAAVLFAASFTTSVQAADPVLIGRRGCGYAVENTSEAYLEGARRGFAMMQAHVRDIYTRA